MAFLKENFYCEISGTIIKLSQFKLRVLAQEQIPPIEQNRKSRSRPAHMGSRGPGQKWAAMHDGRG